MNRTLTFKIFRYNPYDEKSVPTIQEYKLDETPRLNIFSALNRLKDEQDPTLMFDFVCRAGICGSCAMMINSRPTLACRTLTQDLPETIELFPLPFFKMLGDLSVDTGVWFREMGAKVESWIHTNLEFDPTAVEERMDNSLANEIYENERCIECGCCVAGCATAQVYPDFLGAAGLNRIARFMIDPRDERTNDEWFELVSTDDGIFGCIGMMGCDDVCPKDIPLLETLAIVRRKMVKV
ncbi:fumarate reductase iron-sulfur subunit [bacterium]|nr:fumarate reductase iron-sulfur subunit [bacterium]